MTSPIGHGVYTVPEAARLSGIPADRIRRWVFGYTVNTKACGRRRQEGLWRPYYADQDERVLSFHDLLEVRFVHAFRQYGISLQAIRAAAAHARELLETDYPFTCQRFRTDGRTIFAEIADELDSPEERERLLDLVKRQWVIPEAVAHSLYHGIEYDEERNPARWRPDPDLGDIVLDPERCFGKPILDRYGTPDRGARESGRGRGGRRRSRKALPHTGRTGKRGREIRATDCPACERCLITTSL